MRYLLLAIPAAFAADDARATHADTPRRHARAAVVRPDGDLPPPEDNGIRYLKVPLNRL